MSSDAGFKHALRPLGQRRTWARALLRVLAIAVLPAGGSLLVGEPLLAGCLALWILSVIAPSTLIEAVLGRIERLNAPFPLAWTLFLANLILCLYGFFQVVYLLGGSVESLSRMVAGLFESPRLNFLVCAFFAIGLTVPGALAQRKPSWREERLGVTAFFVGAYLVTAALLVYKRREELALISGILGWAFALAILASLFHLGFSTAAAFERSILGGAEQDLLADYLQGRLAERGPLQPPPSKEDDAPDPGPS